MSSSSSSSSSPFTIRAATIDDAAALAAVLRDVGWFQPINAEPEQETIARAAKSLAVCLASAENTLLVAQTPQGPVAGYLFVHWLPNILLGAEGYISELFIKEAQRGQGLGHLLLEAAKQQARERGCARLMLFNRKERASYQRGFYQKQGWVERDDTACFMYFLDN